MRDRWAQLARGGLAAGIAGVALAWFSGEARADFRVCNATQNLVGVAIGYRAQAGWVTEGWWHIEGSSCKTLIEGALSSRYYYLYAEDAERGGRWNGPVTMCVADREFKIAGVSDCLARGFQRSGFQEYDTGEQSSWMVQLTDEAPAQPAAGAPVTSPMVPPGAVAAPSEGGAGTPAATDDGEPAAGSPDTPANGSTDTE